MFEKPLNLLLGSVVFPTRDNSLTKTENSVFHLRKTLGLIPHPYFRFVLI